MPPKPFGHLTILMRDYVCDAEEGGQDAVATLQEMLLEDEKVPRRGGKAASERNQVRALLQSSFESINIWVFPVPVKSLGTDVVSAATLTEGFKAQLGRFRAAVAEQLREPMRFNGAPLTCALLADLVPTIADALNDPKQGMLVPQSLFAQVRCC